MKYVGFSLMIIGVLILIQLILSIPGYLSDFESNPVYEYVVGTESKSYSVTLDGTEVSVSGNFNRIIAMFFGLMVLKIWVNVGLAIVQAGRSLLVDDMDNVKALLNTLLEKRY
ncbi:hypothetical protein GCE9029_00815 [Grimontia celer]|uniref:Uncharacterized protein n=2 Tax=Grimontia celer TaxID=1796497 RepID=A0A128EUY3_9GAMM|nr:hypothetical protein GCE9029_00815 [Grimontia celer]